MVRGIDTFKEFFKGFEDNYVIIGGTACEIHEDLYAQVPRATKDIDIILVVEALSAEFVAKFWEFVKKGNYEQRNKGVNENVEPKHEYFRFMKPANSAFPYQVELFSRSLGLMNFPEEARITPIPVDEDLSSLSAILMDEDYYRFTIEHSLQEDGVHIANIESLICLKSKAFLDLSQRKAKGESVDSKHIAKHKKDVFRLAAMLTPASRYELPNTLKTDTCFFLDCFNLREDIFCHKFIICHCFKFCFEGFKNCWNCFTSHEFFFSICQFWEIFKEQISQWNNFIY